MADGIKNRITPPDMTIKNAYDAPNREGLPATWAEANQMFSQSAFIKSWLGAEYTHVYSATKEYERLTFDKDYHAARMAVVSLSITYCPPAI
jgi:glutamine synthetase